MDVEELYREYFSDVYRYAFSLCADYHLAEDIASETFIKAIKSIDKFKGRSSIKTWLIQIAKNTFYTYANKMKNQSELKEDVASIENVEIQFADKSRTIEIHKVLHLLNEPYKEVFSLRLFSELSFAEIGEIFGKTANWATVTYYRAKNKIREMVSDD